MSYAIEYLAKELSRVSMSNTKIPVVANVTADYVLKADEIRDTLARQIAGSVRWDESISLMARDGVDHFVEVGPGKVLSGLIKRITDTVEIRNAGDLQSLAETTSLISGP
jgi:[acyl-carrier-protein] S-malonyltransferase